MLSLLVTHCTIRCHSLNHSLPFIVTRASLFVVPSRHSPYHSLSFVVIRCHLLPLDVSFVCFFINDRSRTTASTQFWIKSLKSFSRLLLHEIGSGLMCRHQRLTNNFIFKSLFWHYHRQTFYNLWLLDILK